ncbi:MAG: EAL domain-containing protein [Gammaproteobacteria bacterium]|nr:EAL domain-containing protein [Gammaproteobacteria bacterium]
MVERSLDLSSNELLQANTSIRAVLDTLPDLYVLIDSNDIVIDYQAGDSKAMSQRTEEVIGKSFLNMPLLSADDALSQAMQNIRSDAKSLIIEFLYHWNGAPYSFEARFFPVTGDRTAILVRDISDRKLAEYSLHASEKRLREHNRLILTMAKSKHLTSGDIDVFFEKVTATAALGLHVQRASVWLYNHDHSQLECVKLYEQDSDQYSAGMALKADHYPKYFKALHTERTITANDAYSHPATSEFFEICLTPLGISSMLDVSINVGGEVVGVLRNEHAGQTHNWTPEENTFARSMADFVSLAMETREREKAQAALGESEDKFHILAETTDSAIIVFRERFLYTNPAFRRITGYAHNEILKLGLIDLISEDSRQFISHLIHQYEQGNAENLREELRILDKEGNEHWLFLTSSLIRFEGQPAGLATAFDITERKRMEDQLRHQAFHDKLTGLPNRALFLDRLEQAISRSNRHECQFAVLFIDLDRFKPINDSLGHLVGDKLLQEIARRLQHRLRAEDTITRLGGDEFTVLLEELHHPDYAILIARTIQEIICKPCIIEGNEVTVTASIGIALCDTRYKKAENILRDADIAMYRAKVSGKGQYAIFDSSMHERAVSLLELESDMRRAIERTEFELYYQPIIQLKTGQISGFEALIRWNHPQRGLVSPDEFIPIAEDTGLINDIGDWVLEDACRLMKKWQKQLGKCAMPTININVSGRQIACGGLVQKVAAALQKNQIDGANLKLELTESMVMENPGMASSMITELKQYHVQTAIDDFGTGYSSLSYLHQFPIDTLKIDRSFINELKTDGTNAEIVNTIVMLAHNLGLDVVAEGIEEEYQLQHLRSVGCDFAQGYYFAKPIPAGEALAALLSDKTDVIAKNLS